jgi:hypothetical protein
MAMDTGLWGNPQGFDAPEPSSGAMIAKKAGDGGSKHLRGSRGRARLRPGLSMDMGKKRNQYKITNVNIIKIFRTLSGAAREKEGFLTVSEIARRSGVHKWTVSRTLDLYMQSLVEVVQPVELEAIGLQAKLVRLKNPDLTSQQVINYLKLRRKIKT